MAFKFSENSTIGERYDGTFEVKTQKEAQEYLGALLAHSIRYSRDKLSLREAIEREMNNISSYTGYFPTGERERVLETFKPAAKRALRLAEKVELAGAQYRAQQTRGTLKMKVGP